MKKKFLSLIMVVVMTLAIVPFAMVQVSAQEGVSYEAAVAYKAVIDEAYAKYGQYQGYDAGDNMLTGLGLARLVDFDGNGTQELVIGCGSLTSMWRLFYIVYGYENGEIVQYTVPINACDSFDLGFQLRFCEKGNKKYAHTVIETVCQANYHYGTVGDNWEITDYYCHEAGHCDAECPRAGENIYCINGADVSKEEWYAQIEQYQPYDIESYDENWEYYSFGEKGVEKTYALLNDVISKGTETPIAVVLDGEKITFDQNPIIVNDRTLVPMRAIFETLGATVEWDSVTRTVTATKGETVVTMTIDNAVISVNDEQVTLDVAPQIVGDRTLAPARAVAEGFGCSVDWDASTRTVIITSK